MLKYIYLYTACFLGSHLAAETIGNVEFHFPQSQYEWKSLSDFTQIEVEENLYIDHKIFTHREGDALEIFIAVSVSTDEEDLEMNTIETVQKIFDNSINQLFNNHKLIVRAYSEENEFMSWQLFDGEQDIMHGYLKRLKQEHSETPPLQTILSYATTAVETEQNLALWTKVFEQARFID